MLKCSNVQMLKFCLDCVECDFKGKLKVPLAGGFSEIAKGVRGMKFWTRPKN